ncbi:hypothetical protein Phum_PHUM429790 [Pediculus humanus corporis]|uniref:DUF4485 domain-containing protein n=1 Tax=Pediculus humanus subsp. corporis TaxID=121224 RepID=E0VTA8_PEDHC|nr:uncharacterized protein Phum_PHUM429790 [Pediculus humanus corporis]EEB16614.1 hypothetical protein Phum_PHUM429790 [Pediculus humanus corporis]
MAKVLARSKGQTFGEFVLAISRHTSDYGQQLRAAMKVETNNFREYVNNVLSQRIKDLTEVLDEEQNAELKRIKCDISKWQQELAHYQEWKRERVERNLVRLWVNKIMGCNNSLNDLKMRNEFLHCLANCIERGKLSAPFDMDPAKEIPNQEDESMSMLQFLPAKNGGFILPKPLPSVGAYCYLAATAQPQCNP